jgi:signal transduction histidine kinase
LPISAAALQAVQNGIDWFETAMVDEQSLLIYSAPVSTQGRVTQIVQVATPIAEREQSLNTLRLILLVGSAIVILGTFVVGWVLSGTALAPIHRMTQTAQAIGAERNFSRRVDHAGPKDEVGQLATTFNAMLSELESAYRQLQHTLESQRRFVADASHELRTPLTTIRGNIELLKNNAPMDAKERADVYADTKDEIERLIRLVNQLLILARSDAGRLLPLAPVPIKPLIEDVCRQAKLLAPQRTIVWDSALDVNALGDHDALKQVLVILLDNAIAHTPPHATINITTALANQHITIEIKDTGPGIAPELLPHIFERFFRGDRARSGQGMGLGLSIAKELMEAQKGTIKLESQPGEGSTFTVTLPQIQ